MRFFGFACALTACALLGAAFSAPAHAGLRETASWGGEPLPVEVKLTAVAVDDQGRSFVADAERNRIVRIEADGSSEVNWQIRPLDNIPREDPVDLALDDDDNVYALEHIGDRVSSFTEDGDPIASWQIPLQDGVDVSSITWESGSIWVIADDLVRRYSPSGQLLDSWGGFESDRDWTSPLIRGDGEGHLLVSATARSGEEATTSLYRFDLDGTQVSKWSSPAQVYLGYTHGASFITGVEHDYAIAPSPDGDIWAIRPSTGHFFTKLGPGGETGGVGDRGVVPSSFGLAPNGDFISSTRSSIARMDADGEVLRTWRRVDLPKYTGDEFWEGEFVSATELTVSAHGVVGSYDPYLSRAQTSTSDGAFLHRFEAPSNDQSYSDVIRLMMPPGGGTELLNRATGTIERFDDQGGALPPIQLDTDNMFLDVALDPLGGYAALMWGEDTVDLFAADGSLTGSLPVAMVDPPERADERIEVDSEGHIFQLTRKAIHEFDRSGNEIASWEVPLASCLDYTLADLAIDGDDAVYALGLRDGEAVVIKFDSGLRAIWAEPIEQGYVPVPRGYLDVGPDGSVYATTGAGIRRYDQSEAGAPLIGPDCNIDPPSDLFRLLEMTFGPGRRWAVATVRVPGPGWVTVSGPKVLTKEKVITRPGLARIVVKPRPGFLRPTARTRRFKASFKIDYVTAADSSRIGRTAIFKKRPRRSHR